MHKTRKAIDEQQMKMAEASAISSAEELRKEIVRLSQSYHNLGMCYVDFVEKCDELINQFKKKWCIEFANHITGILLDDYTVPEISQLYEDYLNQLKL